MEDSPSDRQVRADAASNDSESRAEQLTNNSVMKGQQMALTGVVHVFGNVLSLAIGNDELRRLGITEGVPSLEEDHRTLLERFEKLQATMGRATMLLSNGQPLKIVDEGHGPMVDLVHSDYRQEVEDLKKK